MNTIHMRTCAHAHTKLSHVMAVYYIRETQQNVITSTPR